MSGNPFQDKMQPKLEKAKNMSDEEKYYTYRGVLYPTLMCPEENMKCIVDMKAREDDVMLVAYPKCGFNWMVGVLRRIIEEGTGRKIEGKAPPLIEFLGPDILKLVDQAPSPRLMGTHLHPDNIPASFKEKKPKTLVIFRNPKDTLVSYYHFCNNNVVLPSVKSWDSFFKDFMNGNVAWGSYFDHALAWEKRMDDPDVLLVTYEDLKQNLDAGVHQISSFFGFNLTDNQVQQITAASSFSAMKENSITSHGSKSIGDVIFRKGEVGDWKNHFTPEQSQEMDEAFTKHLGKTKLGAKLNYDRYCK
uniref:Sulfotransferase n=1 Tax=Iconisemion striatum TaxID=60296 RepID=A0A1A7XT17_9TELE